jgi:predicted Zn-dependent peptidase
MALHTPTTFQLPNGLQVAAVERPYSKTFAIALAIGVGSFDDSRELPGLAHFGEHLAFRGPNKELAETLTELGGYVNAYTGFDHTMFLARGHIDHLPLTIQFVANVLRNEPRTEEDVAKERNIVWHEISGGSNQHDREADLDCHLRAALGDPNWTVSRRKWLTKLKRMSAARVNTFQQLYYHPANARLAFVGSCARDQLRCTFEEPFSSAATGEPGQVKPKQPLQSPKRLDFTVDASPYVWVYFTHLVSHTDALTRFAAEVLARLIGGGPHSALFRQLRTERQLAYSVHADDLLYRHCTGLYCYATVSRWSVNKTLDVMLECENKFFLRGIDAPELDNARLRISRGFETHIDYPEHLATYLAYELLRPPKNALIHPQDYLQFISALTLDDVNEAAKILLSPSRRRVYIGGKIGPFARFRARRKMLKASH